MNKPPRRCSKCNVEESEEHPFAAVRRLCRSCNAERDREYRAKNKEKVQASTKRRTTRWRAAHKDKYNESQREWRKKNPEKVRGYYRKYRDSLKEGVERQLQYHKEIKDE